MTRRIPSHGNLLLLLMVILAFNYVDRPALGIALEDLKAELRLSDTQLGLLTGIAFALFYSIMRIPIARWADRGNRVTIISVTTALWSIAVAMCGVAANFVQLLAIRVGVAVGEAGCYSPSLSLIADYLPRSERPRAVARFMLGIPLAMVIGYFGAGWLNEIYGWRTTFVVLGLPGLLLATFAALALKEPRSVSTGSAPPASLHSVATAPADERPMKEVLVLLWVNGAYRHLLLCFSVWGFFGYGTVQWQPAFFIRSFGLQTGQLGTWLVVVYGAVGILGTWVGGELAARYAADNERLQLIAIAVAYAAMAVLTAAVYLAHNPYLAFGILGLSNIAGAVANGPLFAASQSLVPPRMRAMSIALMYFFCNLIGLGLGPLVLGTLSDAFRPLFGDESLRYALLVFSPGYFLCAWHLWQASRSVDMSAVVQSAVNGA